VLAYWSVGLLECGTVVGAVNIFRLTARRSVHPLLTEQLNNWESLTNSNPHPWVVGFCLSEVFPCVFSRFEIASNIINQVELGFELRALDHEVRYSNAAQKLPANPKEMSR